MTRLIRLVVLVLLGPGATSAQDFAVSIVSSSETVRAGDLVRYTLVAANRGDETIRNARAQMRLPVQITGFSVGQVVGDGLNCGNSSCSANETVTWTVGDLGPGETQTLIYLTRVGTSADDGTAETQLTVSADNESDAAFTHDLGIDSDLVFQLSAVPDGGPAVAGGDLAFTLTYGNVGARSPADVVLRVPVPEGTAFVSATGGGVESGGVVTWELGTVGVGASGQRRLVVRPEAGAAAGHVVRARAEIAPLDGSVPTTAAGTLLPVVSAPALNIATTAGQASSSPGGVGLDLSWTVSNTSGADLSDVAVRILLPGAITGFSVGQVVGDGLNCGNSSCSANETVTWTVGDLGPGEARTLLAGTQFSTSAPQGGVRTIVALATSAEAPPARSVLNLHVDPSPLFHLSATADHAPALAGEPLTYTLTFGNVGSSSPASTTLTATLPDGVSLVSATGGGVESGGVVTWELGTVGVGASGQRRLVVRPEAGAAAGRLLRLRASIDAGVTTEVVTVSESAVPVGASSPLQVAYDLSGSAAARPGPVRMVLMVANTSGADLSDVAVRIRLPERITGFSVGTVVGDGLNCGNSSCSASETVTWNVGTLAPGEIRTIFAATAVRDDAPQGAVSRSVAEATSLTTTPQQLARAFTVDPSQLVRLSAAADRGPVAPGDTVAYTLSFGNVGSTTPDDVTLTMVLPEDATFVDANWSGREADGVVSWSFGEVAPGEGGQVHARVRVVPGTQTGRLLRAEVTLDSGVSTEVPVRTSVAVPIGPASPLSLDYTVTPAVAEPGTPLEFELRAENTSGADLTDVVAEFKLPGGITGFSVGQAVGDGLNCGNSSCSSNETVRWDVGTLAPGQSRQLSFASAVRSEATFRGTLAESPLVGTATGSREVYLRTDLFYGTEVNLPPAVPLDLAASADGDEVTLTWTANADDDLDGYRLYRDTSPGAATLVASLETDATTYTDDGLANGTYYYRLRAIDDGGNLSAYSGEVQVVVGTTSDEDGPAAEFTVTAGPNPAAGPVQFLVSQPAPVPVRLAVYDALGREVAVLIDGERPAGDLAVRWEAGVPAGVYLWRLTAGAEVRTGTLTVVR